MKKRLCKLLQSYFDGQLLEEDVQAFSDHLKVCPRCQVRLYQCDRLSDVLKATQGKIPDKYFFNDIWSRVENKLLQEQFSFIEVIRGHWAQLGLIFRRAFMPIAAVAFIIFLITFPFVEHEHMQTLVPQSAVREAHIGSVGSETHNIFIMNTREKKWTVIWLSPRA